MAGSFEEEPEEQWLVLSRGISADYILHEGTGEIVPLAGRCTLTFDAGFGIVHEATSSEAEPQWAGTLLRKSLFWATRGACNAKELFVGEDGADHLAQPQWRQDLFDRQCHARALTSTAARGAMATEVFVSSLPRGHAFVRWSLPYVVTDLLGAGFKGDYICRRIDDWRKVLHTFGLPSSCITPSTKSVMDAARKQGVALDAASLTKYEREFSCSSSALVVLACHLGTSQRVQARGEANTSSQCTLLLRSLFSEFVPHGSHNLPVSLPSSSGEVVLTVDSQMVNIASCSTTQRKAIEKVAGGSLPVDVATFVVSLFTTLRVSSRLAPARRELLRAVFLALVAGVATEIEATKDDETRWTRTDHLALPLLQNSTSSTNRTRRMAPTLKVQMQEAVAGEHGIRTSAQLLAAKRIFARRAVTAKKLRVAKRCRQGGNFNESRCKQYFMACRRDFNSAKHLWFVVDGVRAGNKEILVIGIGDPLSELHAWSCPQVKRATHRRSEHGPDD